MIIRFSFFLLKPPNHLQGVKDFSVPVGLDAKIKIDLMVVGSVAVSEKGDLYTMSRYYLSFILVT